MEAKNTILDEPKKAPQIKKFCDKTIQTIFDLKSLAEKGTMQS